MTTRAWLIVGLVAASIVIVVAIFLVLNRPWESREYRDCVRQAQNFLGKDFDTSQIEGYCHQIYG